MAPALPEPEAPPNGKIPPSLAAIQQPRQSRVPSNPTAAGTGAVATVFGGGREGGGCVGGGVAGGVVTGVGVRVGVGMGEGAGGSSVYCARALGLFWPASTK